MKPRPSPLSASISSGIPSRTRPRLHSTTSALLLEGSPITLQAGPHQRSPLRCWLKSVQTHVAALRECSTYHVAAWHPADRDDAFLAHPSFAPYTILSVTMPLKNAILEHLDELTSASQVTGACNTIVKVRRADGSVKLVGTNTDVLGT